MTIDLRNDTKTLTEFKRDTSRLLRQMRRTGQPMVLTVNGRAQFVALDVAAYRALLRRVDREEAIEGIRRGLDSVRKGETEDARAMVKRLRRKYEASS